MAKKKTSRTQSAGQADNATESAPEAVDQASGTTEANQPAPAEPGHGDANVETAADAARDDADATPAESNNDVAGADEDGSLGAEPYF